MTESTRPRDAATVLLVRDGADGLEVFLVRRHDKSGFMGGATVFPGGKLDDQDAAAAVLERSTGRSPTETALTLHEAIAPTRAAGLFVAAIRETFEEASVLLADVGPATDITAGRARLLAGDPFLDVLVSLNARLRFDWLHPWARWITPTIEPRRFDARFFVAVCPPAQRAVHDAHETTESAWWRPGAALAAAADGKIMLPPPTLRNLELLLELSDTASVFATASGATLEPIEPVAVAESNSVCLALPGDPAHPVRTLRVAGPTRFVLIDGRWRSIDPPT